MPMSADTTANAPFRFTKFDGNAVGLKARFFSRRDSIRYEALVDQIEGLPPDDPNVRDRVKEAIELGVVGWERSEPYSFEVLAGEFTDLDLAILAVTYSIATQLTEIDRSKSLSRRVSLVDDSAATAQADASTPPATNVHS